MMIARWVGTSGAVLLNLKEFLLNMRTSPFEAALIVFTAAATLPHHLP